MSSHQSTQIKDLENPVFRFYKNFTEHSSEPFRQGFLSVLLSIADPALNMLAPFPIGTADADAFSYGRECARVTLIYVDQPAMFSFAHYITV